MPPKEITLRTEKIIESSRLIKKTTEQCLLNGANLAEIQMAMFGTLNIFLNLIGEK